MKQKEEKRDKWEGKWKRGTGETERREEWKGEEGREEEREEEGYLGVIGGRVVDGGGHREGEVGGLLVAVGHKKQQKDSNNHLKIVLINKQT